MDYQYTFKRNRSPKPSKPPRTPRPNFHNSSNLLSPGLSIITSEKAQLSISSFYNDSLRTSYFTQCFSVIKKIGEGSFGEVFHVISFEDKNHYAIKKYKERHRRSFDRKRGLEEVKKHERISKHDHCVQLFLAWEEDDYLYLQMELCDQNLDNYALNNPYIREDKLWEILLDILLGLKHLHDHNLIHLDMKLENILLSSNGLCKISDFGLATDISQAHIDDLTEGDPKYIAPEIFLGVFTKAADIFSLGLIILELATNLDLPPGGKFWRFLRSGNLPNQLLTHISDDLKSTIKLMIEPNHLMRPSVDQLLSIPKLSELLSNRKRRNYYISWMEFLKKLAVSFYKEVKKRLPIINNNEKNIEYEIQDTSNSTTNNTPEMNSFLSTSNLIEDSPNTTPVRQIVQHSTPICNQHSTPISKTPLTMNTCHLTPIPASSSTRPSVLHSAKNHNIIYRPRNLLNSFRSIEK